MLQLVARSRVCGCPDGLCRRLATWAWLGCMGLLLPGGTLLAAPLLQVAEVPVEVAPAAQGEGRPGGEEDQGPPQLDASGQYMGGAPLKTDPDLMDRLAKADQFRQDGSFRAASQLWQSVLGESGDILYSLDGETYFALAERVESILAGLSPDGLNAYRVAADAAAREILAQSQGDYDLDTLNQIVERYFLSSFGDDAAYQLGCIYLDNHDFVGAARLLRKIAERYPDPSVPLSDVWLRIAIAYIYIGDGPSAEAAIAAAKQAGADSGSRLLEAIRQLLSETPSSGFATATASQWTTRLGSAKRQGQMPALPADYDGTALKADWQFVFEPRDSYLKDAYLGETIIGFDPLRIRKSLSKAETSLIQSWRKGRWRPAGHLLFTDQFMIFKTGADLTVWDRDLQADPVWRPLWLNQFAIDEASAQWKLMQDTYRFESRNRPATAPSSPREIQLFGDQIAQSMSIHRGTLYNLEGHEYSWKADRAPHLQRAQGNPYGSLPRRTRTNRLAAYNLQSGKILWRLPTIDLLSFPEGGAARDVAPASLPGATDQPFEDIGFMAAPVGFGDLLLVPVNVGGSIYVYALDSRNQGQLAWRSYLCDEPGGGSQPWSPIQISVDGSTAYASCGSGVVFAIDPMTGGIRFARRYTRTGEANNYMQRFGGNAEVLELDGWSEDLIIPLGNELVLLASDYHAVWAIDRQTATFRWKTDNRPFGNKFDYLIGINQDYIFLGGQETVAAISIRAEGRWEWVHTFDDSVSLGRAMLTENGIYVPLQDRIVKLGLDGLDGSGRVLAEMPVRLGTTAPLGNLYSDGQRIWVVGGNRLYALGPDDGSISDATEPAVPEPTDIELRTDEEDEEDEEDGSVSLSSAEPRHR